MTPKLLDHFKFPIICTQPKRSNVISIATSIDAVYLDIRLAEKLGYKTSVQSVDAAVETHLLFCTTEILNMDLRKSIFETKKPIKYRCIIVDEVHEQSVEMLNLLNNIKFYQTVIDRDVFVILTSATLDEHALGEQFGLSPKD